MNTCTYLAWSGSALLLPTLFFWVTAFRYAIGVRSDLVIGLIESGPLVAILFTIIFPTISLGCAILGLTLQKNFKFLKIATAIFDILLLCAIVGILIFLRSLS